MNTTALPGWAQAIVDDYNARQEDLKADASLREIEERIKIVENFARDLRRLNLGFEVDAEDIRIRGDEEIPCGGMPSIDNPGGLTGITLIHAAFGLRPNSSIHAFKQLPNGSTAISWQITDCDSLAYFIVAGIDDIEAFQYIVQPEREEDLDMDARRRENAVVNFKQSPAFPAVDGYSGLTKYEYFVAKLANSLNFAIPIGARLAAEVSEKLYANYVADTADMLCRRLVLGPFEIPEPIMSNGAAPTHPGSAENDDTGITGPTTFHARA